MPLSSLYAFWLVVEDAGQTAVTRDAYVYNVLDNGTGRAPRPDFRLPSSDSGGADAGLVHDMATVSRPDLALDAEMQRLDAGASAGDVGCRSTR